HNDLGPARVKTVKPPVARVGTRKPPHAVVVQAINDARAELDQRVEGVGPAVIRSPVNDVVSVERVPPAGADVGYGTYQRTTAGERDRAGGKFARAPYVGPARKFADQDRIGGTVGYAGEGGRHAAGPGPQKAVAGVTGGGRSITPGLQ